MCVTRYPGNVWFPGSNGFLRERQGDDLVLFDPDSQVWARLGMIPYLTKTYAYVYMYIYIYIQIWCVYACMHVCIFASMHLRIYVSMYLCTSVSLSFCLPACLPVCLSACLSVCLCLCLSVCTYYVRIIYVLCPYYYVRMYVYVCVCTSLYIYIYIVPDNLLEHQSGFPKDRNLKKQTKLRTPRCFLEGSDVLSFSFCN